MVWCLQFVLRGGWEAVEDTVSWRALVLQWEVLGCHEVIVHFWFNEMWHFSSVSEHCDWVCRRFTQTACLECRHLRSMTSDSDSGAFKRGPCVCVACGSDSVASDSLQPHGLQPTRLLCPWNSPGKNTGVDWHSLPQRNFPTQGSNPGLLHCRQILDRLSYGEVIHQPFK